MDCGTFSGILVIYGFVLLGVTVPFTGKYYSCCPSNVHRMTPITLGSFGGSLLMFANLTLVCAILFGEFQVKNTHMMEIHIFLYNFISFSDNNIYKCVIYIYLNI